MMNFLAKLFPKRIAPTKQAVVAFALTEYVHRLNAGAIFSSGLEDEMLEKFERDGTFTDRATQWGLDAVHFGTIYPDMLGFYVTPCDQCLGGADVEPACVRSCGRGALAYRDVDPEEPRLYILDERLAARSDRWVKREDSS